MRREVGSCRPAPPSTGALLTLDRRALPKVEREHQKLGRRKKAPSFPQLTHLTLPTHSEHHKEGMYAVQLHPAALHGWLAGRVTQSRQGLTNARVALCSADTLPLARLTAAAVWPWADTKSWIRTYPLRPSSLPRRVRQCALRLPHSTRSSSTFIMATSRLLLISSSTAKCSSNNSMR